MSLAAATTHYQQLLEHHRMRPDCEETWAMLQQARSELEVAHAVHHLPASRQRLFSTAPTFDELVPPFED